MTEPAERAIRLRPTAPEEVAAIAAMERDGDTASFVTAQTVEEHTAALARPEYVYRSIVDGTGALVGFIIMVLEADGESVELARIVVARRGRGDGTRALRLAERECREVFGRRRIWLDVFDGNARARRVYEACGYSLTGTGELRGEALHFLEKRLEQPLTGPEEGTP